MSRGPKLHVARQEINFRGVREGEKQTVVRRQPFCGEMEAIGYLAWSYISVQLSSFSGLSRVLA